MYVRAKESPLLSLSRLGRRSWDERFRRVGANAIKVYGRVYACSFGIFHDNAL